MNADLEAFMKLADTEDAYMRAEGLHLDDRSLLIEAARSMAFVGNGADAMVLANYARSRATLAWKTDAKVLAALKREAADGDPFARELLNRANGKPGQYENGAAAEYWRLKADAYRTAGNVEAAELCERIAVKPDGGRDVLTAQPGKRIDPRAVPRRKMLDEYESATAHLVPKGWPARRDEALPKSDAEFAIASRLAERCKKSMHDFRNALRRERNARRARVERESLK